jgi:hypothetical protein
MFERLFSFTDGAWARWLLLVPGACVAVVVTAALCAVVGFLLQSQIIAGEFTAAWLRNLSFFFTSCAWVAAGALIAPAYRRFVASALSALPFAYAAYALIVYQDWGLGVWVTLGAIAASITVFKDAWD